MAVITRAAFKMIRKRARASTAGAMAASTRDPGLLVNSMELEYLSKKMAGDRKDNGKMVKELNGSMMISPLINQVNKNEINLIQSTIFL